MTEDHPYRGYLEKATHYNPLPTGGSIRPADAINLAARLCEIEGREGRLATLADLLPFDQELCQRFARWPDAPNYGTLAEMVVRECRRITADLS